MFSFKPVGIYLPVDVNNVAFLQHELPEETRNKDSETHNKKSEAHMFVYIMSISDVHYKELD